jgi:hypothetical protein
MDRFDRSVDLIDNERKTKHANKMSRYCNVEVAARVRRKVHVDVSGGSTAAAQRQSGSALQPLKKHANQFHPFSQG